MNNDGKRFGTSCWSQRINVDGVSPTAVPEGMFWTVGTLFQRRIVGSSFPKSCDNFSLRNILRSMAVLMFEVILKFGVFI